MKGANVNLGSTGGFLGALRRSGACPGSVGSIQFRERDKLLCLEQAGRSKCSFAPKSPGAKEDFDLPFFPRVSSGAPADPGMRMWVE